MRAKADALGCANRHADGEQRKHHLPQGQAEQDALLIPLDLFVDFHFDDESLLFFSFFWNGA